MGAPPSFLVILFLPPLFSGALLATLGRDDLAAALLACVVGGSPNCFSSATISCVVCPLAICTWWQMNSLGFLFSGFTRLRTFCCSVVVRGWAILLSHGGERFYTSVVVTILMFRIPSLQYGICMQWYRFEVNHLGTDRSVKSGRCCVRTVSRSTTDSILQFRNLLWPVFGDRIKFGGSCVVSPSNAFVEMGRVPLHYHDRGGE